MIVCDRYQFIYVGLPKTASTSLHHWLSQPGLCPVRWSSEKQDQHSTVIPVGKETYQILVSVRHPMERFVSLWKQFTSPSSVAKVPGCFVCDLYEFLLSQPLLTDFFRFGQMEWVSRLPRVDGWLRCDTLEQDLARMPWYTVSTEVLPRRNKTKHGKWQEIMTVAEQLEIRRRWKEDWKIYDWDTL